MGSLLRKQAVLLTSAGLILAAGGCWASDTTQARNLAANCATCHGTNGKSAAGMASLAGQRKEYIIQQVQDFKSGKRPATVMQQLAKGYTDEQIALIAEYFSAQR